MKSAAILAAALAVALVLGALPLLTTSNYIIGIGVSSRRLCIDFVNTRFPIDLVLSGDRAGSGPGRRSVAVAFSSQVSSFPRPRNR